MPCSVQQYQLRVLCCLRWCFHGRGQRQRRSVPVFRTEVGLAEHVWVPRFVGVPSCRRACCVWRSPTFAKAPRACSQRTYVHTRACARVETSITTAVHAGSETLNNLECLSPAFLRKSTVQPLLCACRWTGAKAACLCTEATARGRAASFFASRRPTTHSSL